MARVNFPRAILIVDPYHVLERLHQLCQNLYAGQPSWAQRMEEQWKGLLHQDQGAEVIAAARRRLGDLALVSYRAMIIAGMFTSIPAAFFYGRSYDFAGILIFLLPYGATVAALFLWMMRRSTEPGAGNTNFAEQANDS